MSTPHAHDNHENRAPNWSRINQWLLWIGLAAAATWLFLRHGAHWLELAPFLLVLACPLMHVFGHRHGSHAHHRNKAVSGADDRADGTA